MAIKKGKRELIVIALFTLSLLLVASFSYTSSAVCSIHYGPVTQPQDATQNHNSQTEAKNPLPPPTGFVNDYVTLFNSESRARLESVLKELIEKADIDFKVVVIETTGGQPLFDYSLAVARAWGTRVKDRSKGGGALFMLALKDRNWRIQITDSLKEDLPTQFLKELGDQSQELYRQGKYAEGITKYVEGVIRRLEEIRGFKLGSKP